MKFEYVIQALRNNKKVRRKVWPTGAYIQSPLSYQYMWYNPVEQPPSEVQEEPTIEMSISYICIMADDWEIVE